MSHIHDRLSDWWDADASTYDASAGHAMTDPVEAAAWRQVLVRALPPAPARVLDVGAGTGALALLAAELGYDVTAIDLSEGMLAKARAKASERGHDVTFVHGPAEEPPAGPFDAVMERHVSWTLPDPMSALRAWRAVTVPGGRLVLLEGSWAGEGPWVAAKDALAAWVERARGIEDDHHAPYPDDILSALPLRRTTSTAPFLDAVWAAGWSRVRIARLRDVEWAAEARQPWPLGWLTHRARYAIVAEA
jgi:SAM-dependent methyltransferase